MKKSLGSFTLGCILATSLCTFAQESTKQDNMKQDTSQQDSMKNDQMKQN